MPRKIHLRNLLLLAACLLASACAPATPSKPNIILASPPHGSEFRAGENVVVQSVSTDATGIARVELLVDGAIVRADAAPSPQTQFNVIQNWKATQGTHIVLVRAYNTRGVGSEPAAISISVVPAATPIAAATLAPTPLPTRVAVSTATRLPTPTSTQALPTPPRIQEQTRYEGIKEYTCDPRGCWRTDGKVDAQPEYFYPDIDANNSEIQKLLGSIGAPAEVAGEDTEKWRRVRGVWAWLNKNALPLGHPQQEAPWNYLGELMKTPKDHWPSIGDLAKVYSRYGVLAWGACNSRAFMLATLLYRAGIRPDDQAVVIAQWKPEYSQHLYVVLRIENRWHYLDPTCSESHPVLSDAPENVGCNTADYAHPNTILVLPGSSLGKPMLVR